MKTRLKNFKLQLLCRHVKILTLDNLKKLNKY